MKKILLEDALILRASKALRFLVRVLPLPVSCRIGRSIGHLFYVLTTRRHIAYKNLRFCFKGEKSRSEINTISRQSMVNLAVSMVELLRFPDLTRDYIEKHVRIVNLEKVQPSLDAHKGVIFLTGHFGNWELLNATACLVGHPLAALARAQKHPRSDEFLNSLRASQGSEIIYKGMMIRQLIRVLREGKAVGILSDQDGGRNGVFVRLFGRASSTPRGVVAFALKAGAPIFPGFIFRENQMNHRIEMEAALDFPKGLSEEETEKAVLQQFATLLEAKIRKDPTMWMWGHRRWKSTTTRFVVVLSDGKAGHLNQSLAVSEALAQYRRGQGLPDEETQVKVVEVKFKNPILRKLFQTVYFLGAGNPWFEQSWMNLCLDEKTLADLWAAPADIFISCGSSIAGVSLALKRDLKAKAAIVMKPPFGAGRFDAVIAPLHDKITPSANVFITERVLSLANPKKALDEARKLKDELGLEEGCRTLGVLIGGDTEDVQFSKEIFEKNTDDLLRLAKGQNLKIFVTTSRRTPPWADEILKEKFSDRGICPLLVIANEKNRPGVVNAILGLCESVVVTAESMSMVSEAIASGKRVMVFTPFKADELKPKYKRFLDFMKQKKQIEMIGSENMTQTFLNFKPQKSSEAERSDEQVLSRAMQRILG